jgi:hypothetical protein
LDGGENPGNGAEEEHEDRHSGQLTRRTALVICQCLDQLEKFTWASVFRRTQKSILILHSRPIHIGTTYIHLSALLCKRREIYFPR